MPGALWFPGDRHDSRYSMSPLKPERPLQPPFPPPSPWFQEMLFKKKVVMLLLSSTSYSLCCVGRGAGIQMSECYVLSTSLFAGGGGCLAFVQGRSDPLLLFPQ